MKREIIQTNDGSTTIYLPKWHESYHSRHGAIQEAYHVFIKNGLSCFDQKTVSVLEIGFGTGLNCFITLLESLKKEQFIDYVGVEAYPVTLDEVLLMNYPALLGAEDEVLFKKIHESEWEKKDEVTPNFNLTKHKLFFQEIDFSDTFDIIYFDAFGFRVQPELWTESIFALMFKALKTNGILVTYACRSVIKHAMVNCGFTVEKLPGAPGKREMLRAVKR